MLSMQNVYKNPQLSKTNSILQKEFNLYTTIFLGAFLIIKFSIITILILRLKKLFFRQILYINLINKDSL
jgi:hypothetical protein